MVTVLVWVRKPDETLGQFTAIRIGCLLVLNAAAAGRGGDREGPGNRGRGPAVPLGSRPGGPQLVLSTSAP